ncbi:MAG: c-type cytochrome [Campylobacterota bacterium]|nr:c-type cytochrome [Campylobacterota bacterium]
MKKLTKIVLGLAVLGATSLSAMDGAALYKKCAGCHGPSGEKKALGKSMVIQGWEVEKTVTALKGYKDGTYGGVMKGVMKGQVTSLNDEQIESIAKFLATK